MDAPAKASRETQAMRGSALGAIVFILVMAGLGIGTNLYASLTRHHPGASPSDYFQGGYDSVVWAIGDGPGELAAHAAGGLALVFTAIGVALRAVRYPGRSIGIWAVLGGLFILAAGFNGAAFLNYNDNVSSLLMALFAFAAIFCYARVIFAVRG